MSANLDRVPIFMRDLADVAARVLQAELGLPPDRAETVGMLISRSACEEHAGEMIYIPSGQALVIDERDQEMYAVYVASGRNINVVVQQFRVAAQTAYKRIRMVEAALQAKRQRPLFDDGDDTDA